MTKIVFYLCLATQRNFFFALDIQVSRRLMPKWDIFLIFFVVMHGNIPKNTYFCFKNSISDVIGYKIDTML